MEIIKPGLLSTIQDTGRRGYQKYGIIKSGGMDQFALKSANLLVGNDIHEAAIEITLAGPIIHFDSPALISICGGDFCPTIDGVNVPLWRPLFVKKSSILKFGTAKSEIRSYLAIAGGFDVPQVLNSKSTYLRANIGGYKGRALQAGDVLYERPTPFNKSPLLETYTNNKETFVPITKTIANHVKPDYKSRHIRVLKGAEHDWFTDQSNESFFSHPFKILPQSDRMGYRLAGPPLELKEEKELISGAVSFGTIQVPSNGQPIILMADHQTTGGYPKIAHIISVDLPIIAQLNSNTEIQFKEVSLEEAHSLYIRREKDLQLIKYGMREEFRRLGGR